MHDPYYAWWKGEAGPGAELKSLLNNKTISPKQRKEIDKRYAEWCESELAPQHSGPCKTRANKYREIFDQVVPEKKK